MQNSQTEQNYVKLAFNKVQLSNHVQLQATKYNILKLQFFIDVQLISNNNQLIGKLSSIKLYETSVKEGSLFHKKSNRWDCIKLDPKYDHSKAKLKLKFRINQSKNDLLKKVGESFELIMDKYQVKSNGQKQLKSQQNSTKNDSENSTLPIELQPIIIPLDKLFKYSYKIHEINLDFNIPKQKRMKSSLNNNQSLNESPMKSSNDKQEEHRDGLLNFQLIYMPQTTIQLKLQNIQLYSKTFCKNYKLFVYQIFNEHSEIQLKKNLYKQRSQKYQNYSSSVQYKSGRQVYDQSKSKSLLYEIPFEVNGWEHFRNTQSFRQALIVPMQISNNLDQVVLMLQYDAVSSNEKSDSKLKSVQKQLTKQKNLSKYIALSKIIGVQDFLKKRQNPKQWTEQVIQFKHESLQFKLQFQFMVNIGRGSLSQVSSTLKPSRSNLQLLQKTPVQNKQQQFQLINEAQNPFVKVAQIQETKNKNQQKPNSQFVGAFLSGFGLG